MWEDDDFGLGIDIRTKERTGLDWTWGGDGKIKAGRVQKGYVGRLNLFPKRWFWIRGRGEFYFTMDGAPAL
jgi:hypothetical protein